MKDQAVRVNDDRATTDPGEDDGQAEEKSKVVNVDDLGPANQRCHPVRPNGTRPTPLTVAGQTNDRYAFDLFRPREET
jgi:hypothetical protein